MTKHFYKHLGSLLTQVSFPRFMYTSPFRRVGLQRKPILRASTKRASPLRTQRTPSAQALRAHCGHMVTPHSYCQTAKLTNKVISSNSESAVQSWSMGRVPGSWFVTLNSTEKSRGKGGRLHKKIIRCPFLKESYVLPHNSRHEKPQPRIEVLVSSPFPALMLPQNRHPRVNSPADMAIVVPATMPMVTPLPLGGGMGAGYTVAGMPLGCTTVVWWMT